MYEDDKPIVVIADDEEISRAILREILKNDYRILEAENGNQAVLFLSAKAKDIALLILDIHMPKLDGFGVIEYMRTVGLENKIPVVITTADTSAEILMAGRDHHVADIFYKPFRAADIKKRVDLAVSISHVERRLPDIIAETADYLNNQYIMLKKAHLINLGRWEDNLKALIAENISDTEAHNLRIEKLTELLCNRIVSVNLFPKMTTKIAKIICKAIPAHDFGRLVIPDSIFDKKDISAEKALLELKKRPVAAGELVNLIFTENSLKTERKICHDMCTYMYERYDGKGYPEGLRGDEIPIPAQILGLAHRYDELRFRENGRVENHRAVMRTILENESEGFNPSILDVFEELSSQIEAIIK